MTQRIRLHISPLNADLVHTLLPPAILATTSSISYHTIDTFPERNYGYVELPIMEAEKIKKKLNGSILKGTKIKIEEARPEKKTKTAALDATQEKDEHEKKASKAGKKRKREEGVLLGYELSAERKVKRGWTKPGASTKDSKLKKSSEDKKGKKERRVKTVPSTFSDEAECLFRTKLPPNAVDIPQASSKGVEKSKKSKKGKSDSELVVHEFANTTKHPNFLRTSQDTTGKKAVAEYVDDKGWVDKDGAVIEPGSQTERTRRATRSATKPSPEKPIKKHKLEVTVVEENTSSEGAPPNDEEDADDTSSSGTSSSSDDDEDEHDKQTSLSEDVPASSEKASFSSKFPIREVSELTVAAQSNKDATHADTVRSNDRSSPSQSPSQTTPIPEVTVSSTEAPPEVHPLEALFKRPKPISTDTPRKPPPNLEVKTSFSFFAPDNDSTDPPNPLIPQTPFTQRDLHYRSMRSAAPTPDTAAPGKSGFGNLWGINDDVESEEDTGKEKQDRDAAEGSAKTTGAGEEGQQPAESDFAKWFWEHRGENNRAWKRRKREAGKEKRQRENRRRGRSAV